MKILKIMAAAAAAILISATPALAAVTVKAEPTIEFSGDSATVSGGNFSGLGNIPLFGELTVSGIAEYTCYNPQGHPSPGQNPVEAQSGSSGPVELPTSKNGRATVPNIEASVEAPPTPTAQQVGCGGQGSTQWTVVLDSLTATSAQFVVTQVGVELFCWNYVKGEDPTGTPC